MCKLKKNENDRNWQIWQNDFANNLQNKELNKNEDTAF